MAFKSSNYLQRHGWKPGTAFSPNGISKPVIVSRKDNLAGVGRSKHGDGPAGPQWWEAAFNNALKNIDSSYSSTPGHVDGTATLLPATTTNYQSPLYRNFVKGKDLEGTIGVASREGKKEEDKSQEVIPETVQDSAGEAKLEIKRPSKKERKAMRKARLQATIRVAYSAEADRIRQENLSSNFPAEGTSLALNRDVSKSIKKKVVAERAERRHVAEAIGKSVEEEHNNSQPNLRMENTGYSELTGVHPEQQIARSIKVASFEDSTKKRSLSQCSEPPQASSDFAILRENQSDDNIPAQIPKSSRRAEKRRRKTLRESMISSKHMKLARPDSNPTLGHSASAHVSDMDQELEDAKQLLDSRKRKQKSKQGPKPHPRKAEQREAKRRKKAEEMGLEERSLVLSEDGSEKGVEFIWMTPSSKTNK